MRGLTITVAARSRYDATQHIILIQQCFQPFAHISANNTGTTKSSQRSVCMFTASPARWSARPETATAATRSIIIESALDLSCLQQWLEQHGDQIQVLQLRDCSGAALTALPCAQLQDLLLHGNSQNDKDITIGSRVWGDIASATKLTSVSLDCLQTAAQQADVVSALTALPDLEQLTWRGVQCSGELLLRDSLLLCQMTKLTRLDVLLSYSKSR